MYPFERGRNFQKYSEEGNSYRFEVQLLRDYVTVCCECGVVRKDGQVFHLLQPSEVALRWVYLPVSGDIHLLQLLSSLSNSSRKYPAKIE